MVDGGPSRLNDWNQCYEARMIGRVANQLHPERAYIAFEQNRG
jgi:hypothetical protein